jgi:chaperonin GroEL
MITEGVKNVTAGANPVDIKRGIERATEAVVAYIKKESVPVTSKEKIQQVATISANNDEEIGALIADAMERVGQTGVITVEDAKGVETSLRVVEGMQFDRGFISPYMATDQEKMTAELADCAVLITDKRISSMKQLIPALERVAGEGKPILIIAEDVEGEAVATIVLNIIRGTIKVVAVKAPGFGDDRKELLEDIATLTGGTVVSEEKGMKLESFQPEFLGHARKVRVNKDSTMIIEGKGEKKAIDRRKALIEAQHKAADSEYRKTELAKRLAKLGGGVAVIEVGAATETEMKEKKARIDDALHATKAATQEGVVVGGGITLLRAQTALDTLKLSGDEQVGVAIVRRALEEPVRQIARNAGVESAEVVSRLRSEKDLKVGYNAKTGAYENLFTAGVIDPTKVVRSAVQNAASITAMVLTTEAIVVDYDDEKDDKLPTVIL